MGVASLIWTALVVAGWTQEFDRAVLSWAGRAGADHIWLRDCARIVTRMGDGASRIAIALLAALFLLYRKRRLSALALAFLVGGGILLSEGLKAVIDRPRPDVVPWLDAIHNASYPSGHAMGATILALSLSLTIGGRLLWALALPYVLLVSASRMVLGVHWPSDIIGGWLIGTAWVCFIMAMIEYIGQRDRCI